MNFVDTIISCEPAAETRTDVFTRIDYLKKSLIQIGIIIAAISFSVTLIIAFLYLFTRKQLFTTDNNVRTTIMFQNYSTSTAISSNLTATGNPPIIAGEKFGDIQGSAFDDSLMNSFTSFHYFRGIIMQTDDILHWIQCFYSSNSSSEDFLPGIIHGIRDPTDLGEPFFLDEDEKIDKVQVKVRNVKLYNNNVPAGNPRLVVAVRFFTTKGRSSPDISQVTGDNYTEKYPGYTLGYIAGRSGRYINQLQFYWYLTMNK